MKSHIDDSVITCNEILKSEAINLLKNVGLIEKNNVDVDKIITSNKISFGKKGVKYFTCYKDNEKTSSDYV